jgi:hypothetical protein
MRFQLAVHRAKRGATAIGIAFSSWARCGNSLDSESGTTDLGHVFARQRVLPTGSIGSASLEPRINDPATGRAEAPCSTDRAKRLLESNFVAMVEELPRLLL